MGIIKAFFSGIGGTEHKTKLGIVYTDGIGIKFGVTVFCVIFSFFQLFF